MILLLTPDCNPKFEPDSKHRSQRPFMISKAECIAHTLYSVPRTMLATKTRLGKVASANFEESQAS